MVDLLTDLSKAFECINHEPLKDNLKHMVSTFIVNGVAFEQVFHRDLFKDP